MRIGIANDVSMAAEMLRRVLTTSGEHQLAWIARTGAEALRMCIEQRPDLVLMDLNMPEMDGVEATRLIMQQAPCAILVVTGNPQDSVAQVFRAMGAGALDVTATPLLHGDDGGKALLAKIKTIGKLVRASEAPPATAANAPAPAGSAGDVTTLLAIGASTGGPLAIASLLANWRLPPSCALVVVQHIDENFAGHFAKWLAEQLLSPVRVIDEGERLAGGCIQIARTNDHLSLDAQLRLRYCAEPRDYAYRPSIDVFFHAVARHWRGQALGVLLTGMGRDGADGLLAMRRAGKATYAQDQASSAVYGMPRAAAELGAAENILPLDRMGAALRAKIGHRTNERTS